jgi:orotidine-5'-phosphate decarboxylase
LDSEYERLPAALQKNLTPQYDFNCAIIDATHDVVCAYKPNMAFYEARGDQGMSELKMTMEYLQEYYPDIFTICDAKRADIGSTNRGYVREIFDWFGFDAITLHPYLGRDALQPFLEREDKTSIILCRTSNPGSDEFQELSVKRSHEQHSLPLWQYVAQQVAEDWDTAHNCMLVVGATYPESLRQVRAVVGDMPLLIPGIGAQGGDLAETLTAGLTDQKDGLVINSSRNIIFSAPSGDEDFAAATHRAATDLHQRISSLRTV